MQLKFLPFIAILAVSGCAPRSAPLTGRQIVAGTAPSFTSQTQGFSVWLPSQPQESKESKPLEGITVDAFIFKADAPPLTYAVISTPVPAKGVNTSNLGPELDAMQEGFVKGAHATLQNSEKIQLGGYQGSEANISLADGQAQARVRFYVTPKFFYQIMAGGPADAVKTQVAQIDQMLNSFRILPQ